MYDFSSKIFLLISFCDSPNYAFINRHFKTYSAKGFSENMVYALKDYDQIKIFDCADSTINPPPNENQILKRWLLIHMLNGKISSKLDGVLVLSESHNKDKCVDYVVNIIKSICKAFDPTKSLFLVSNYSINYSVNQRSVCDIDIRTKVKHYECWGNALYNITEKTFQCLNDLEAVSIGKFVKLQENSVEDLGSYQNLKLDICNRQCRRSIFQKHIIKNRELNYGLSWIFSNSKVKDFQCYNISPDPSSDCAIIYVVDVRTSIINTKCLLNYNFEIMGIGTPLATILVYYEYESYQHENIRLEFSIEIDYTCNPIPQFCQEASLINEALNRKLLGQAINCIGKNLFVCFNSI